jgi:hypothetical protein
MSLTAQRTPELEAVNIILSMLGEREISALPSAGGAEANILQADLAEKTLHRVNREVQSEGWSVNTELQVELTADGSGFLNLDTDVIKVDATDTTKKYVQRGTKIFNAEAGENTFVFTVGEVVEVDLVRMLAFTDLPETLRRYITIKAGRLAIMEYLRDPALSQQFAEQELMAKLAADNEQWQTGETSMFQNFDSFTIVNREPRALGHNRAIINGFID